jgi:hypothetical protein
LRKPRSQERIRKKIQQSNDKIAELKRSFNASHSSEVGGYIDTRPGTSFQARSSSSGISLPDTGMLISSIKGTAASDFTEIRTDISEITGSTDQLVGPIGGVLMFISLFLPWVSFMGMSANIFTIGGFVSAFSLIAALLGIGSAFLVRDNARGTLQFIVGGVTLVYQIISNVYSLAKYGSLGIDLIIQVLGIGFYLFIIGAVMLTIGGMIELKKG